VPSGVTACQPVAAPASCGWLDYLNYYRATAGLPPVTNNAAWSDGARKHSIYIVKNNALQHGEDPDNAWYTPEGHLAAQQSDIYSSDDMNHADWRAIDTWMQSPFHAVGILDPRLVQVGYGSYREGKGNLRMGAALNVIAGMRHPVEATYPIFWPGNGTTIPISRHRGEYPSPLSSCPGYSAPSGLPLIVQMGSGRITPVVSATSFTRNGQPLEHCVFDETTYTNPDRAQQKLGRNILGARNAIVLIPRAPLSPGGGATVCASCGGKLVGGAFDWVASRIEQDDAY
jgi:hypothetical protein